MRRRGRECCGTKGNGERLPADTRLFGFLMGDPAMADSDSRSLEEIRRDTERTRAGLTATVDQLRTTVVETAGDVRERLSPDSIKSEIGSYVRASGQRFVNDLVESARANPLQAVAVGVSTAVPLLRVVRAIPVPVLLAGAGLFLARSQTGKELTRKASDMAADLIDRAGDTASDLRARAAEASGELRGRADRTLGEAGAALSSAGAAAAHRVSQLTGDLKEAASGGAAAASNALQDAQGIAGAQIDQLAHKANNAGRSAAGLLDQASVTAADVAAVAQDKLNSVVGTARQTLAEGADRARDLGLQARERALELGSEAQQRFRGTAQNHPLVLAGFGLAVGALIAAALPRSRVEDSVVGGASDKVKRQANAAANQGFEGAKTAASEAFGDIQRRAAEQGLTPDTLDQSARDLGDRVRKVAEAAVTTAFEIPRDDADRNGRKGGH
jgi:hypothetical protein